MFRVKGKRKGTRGVRASLPDFPGPPGNGGQVNDHDAWMERNAAQARHALADPAVRAALLALLGSDDSGRRRERRLEAARRELAGLEARWPLLEEDEHEP